MRICLVYLLLHAPFFVHAQPEYDLKRDNVWKLGYDFNSDTPGIDHVYFDFRGNTLKIDTLRHTPGGEINYMNTSLSDDIGNLLFYSNGCEIYNANNKIIPGGERINDGPLFNELCVGRGYTGHQGMLSIPVSKAEVYLFYLYSEDIARVRPGATQRYLELRSAKIVQDVETNLPEVFDVETLIHKDTFGAHLTACRHANGRDWWMILPKEATNIYNVFLVSSEGIELKHTQSIGDSTNWFHDFNAGECVFTPDGTKFIRFAPVSDLQIFDFDRCTGEFSNPIHIPIVDGNEQSFSAGTAVSSSSQFLYAVSLDSIYQFDLWANSIADTKITIGEYIPPDTTQQFWWIKSRFFVAELAPDDKIYISSPGCRRSVHTIEQPNLKGRACEFKQSYYGDLALPIGGGLPNHPNYHLGQLVGSPCDTIDFTSTNNKLVITSEKVKLYPNPASEVIYIDVKGQGFESAICELYSVQGKLLKSKIFSRTMNSISTEGLNAGIYIVKIINDKGEMISKKVFILK